MKENLTAGLARLREMAGKQGTLEVADILKAFPGVELDEEKVTAIHAYLEQEGISLADYVPHDTNSLNLGSDMELLYGDVNALDAEEQKLFDMYMEDLTAVLPLSGEEEKRLCVELLEGDAARKKAAANRLTEGNLRWVVQIAKGFAGKGASLGDLIQEGNLALALALAEYEGGELSEFLEPRIREAMKALLKEQAGHDRISQRMAADANRILETVKEAEEETGEAVSAAELAKRLGMSVSRVEEVLKESAKAIRNEERNA